MCAVKNANLHPQKMFAAQNNDYVHYIYCIIIFNVQQYDLHTIKNKFALRERVK